MHEQENHHVDANCMLLVGYRSVRTGNYHRFFHDFDINIALANKTDLGSFFATYGSYFSYCLYPAAGACLYVGLKKKGDGYHLLA